jgi:hypothetical protein
VTSAAAAAYQLLEPWQELAHVRAPESQPIADATSFTPFWCVAGLAVVVL